MKMDPSICFDLDTIHVNTQSNTIIDVLNYTQNNIFDEFKTFVFTQNKLLLNLYVEIKDILSS